MKVKIGDNIKRFRKNAKMTQEQLAETMGVSVSAVYKWESGQSSPELRLVLELADLFHTSTDVLLGFEWQNHSIPAVLDRIEALAQEGNTDEAMIEAEKALKSFPNSFEIVYRSAMLYHEQGESAGGRKANKRAVELLHHACELLSQNQDEAISEVSIRTMIANAYLRLMNTDAALRTLKKHNVCGINNARIGMVLADYLHDTEAAEPYLKKAFSKYTTEINDIMVGYANVFFRRGDYQAAIDCFRWLRTVLRGIQPEEDLTWFDKYDCVILESVAECCCMTGEFGKARHYLKEAVDKALQYDRTASEKIADMQFFTTLGLDHQPRYDEYGKTAMECLRRRIQPNDEIPVLYAMWKEIQEEQEHETV